MNIDRRHLRLGPELLLVGPPDVANHRLLVGADRALGKLGDLASHLQRTLEAPSRRHDLVCEADPKRLLRVDGTTGDDHLHRLRVAHDERQPDGHPVPGDDVPAALQGAEDGVLGDDPDVGQERVLEPRGDGPAVHRRDHGLEHVEPTRVSAVPGRVVEVGAELVPIVHLRLGRVREIPAGAERLARTRDHEHEGLVVVAKPPPGVVKLVVHLAADGVSLLGAVVGENGDVAVPLIADRLVAHRSSWGSRWLSSRVSVLSRSSRRAEVRSRR